MLPSKRPQDAARALNDYTEQYLELFNELSIRYNVNIIGGSHLIIEEEKLYNVAYLFPPEMARLRNSIKSTSRRAKKMVGCLQGVSVCRSLLRTGVRSLFSSATILNSRNWRGSPQKRGANIIFVPYNTDMRSGHLRVSYCAHARAIENHVYVALAGACGNLPHTQTAEIHYAQSGIYTSSVISFDREAVAAECTPNAEMVA